MSIILKLSILLENERFTTFSTVTSKIGLLHFSNYFTSEILTSSNFAVWPFQTLISWLIPPSTFWFLSFQTLTSKFFTFPLLDVLNLCLLEFLTWILDFFHSAFSNSWVLDLLNYWLSCQSKESISKIWRNTYKLGIMMLIMHD